MSTSLTWTIACSLVRIVPLAVKILLGSSETVIVSCSSGVQSILLIMCIDALEPSVNFLSLSLFTSFGCSEGGPCASFWFEDRIYVLQIVPKLFVSVFGNVPSRQLRLFLTTFRPFLTDFLKRWGTGIAC